MWKIRACFELRQQGMQADHLQHSACAGINNPHSMQTDWITASHEAEDNDGDVMAPPAQLME